MLSSTVRSGFLAIAALLAVWSVGARADADKVALEAALVRVESIVQGKEMFGDSVFLISHGARQRGKSLDLRLLPQYMSDRGSSPDATKNLLRNLQYAAWELRDKPIPRFFLSVPARGALKLDRRSVGVLRDPARMDQRYQEQGSLVFMVVRRALTCEGRKSVTELVGIPDYEYVSTHQILGLVFAVQRGCITRQAASTSLGMYVARVRDEFELELEKPLTDLQVERAATLCLVGQCGLVPRSFVRKVVQAQSPDGGWRLDDLLVQSGNVSFEHSTALAYCLLAYAQRR